ncbi:uncharacterized protein LOC135138925 isoform X2 [Zophobas morio]|uniref:uncharacterized protein LOC135138925 isoform X2 n=1 Tax=Zophobas morio TaxID=2755281 RepID=UPI003083CD57
MDLMERKFKHKKSRCCRFGFLCRKRAEENIEILHNRSLEARTANETNAVKSEDTSVNQPVVFGSNHQITDTNEYIGQINGFSREGDVEINQISSVKQTDLIMLEDALDQHLGNNEQQDKEKNKTFPEKHIDPKRPEDASNKQPDISYGDDQQIEDDVSKIDEENSKTCPEEIDPKRPEDASNEQLDILCGDNQQTEDDVSEENGAKNKTCPEKIFRKKTGTTDKGRQYEDMITANVALKMIPQRPRVGGSRTTLPSGPPTAPPPEPSPSSRNPSTASKNGPTTGEFPPIPKNHNQH